MQISDDVIVESSFTSKENEEVSVMVLFLKQGQWKGLFFQFISSLG